MFMVVVIAAAAAAPVAELPKGSDAACGATIEKVEWMPGAAQPLLQPLPIVPSFGWSPEAQQQARTVSYIVGGEAKAEPVDEGKLPDATAREKGPAVLLPNCAEPPKVKRRKRLSDYPMG
jgi:hypothetical protein